MTNPMNPSSKTIPEGDPTKIRSSPGRIQPIAYSMGFGIGWLDAEIADYDIRNPVFLSGYFAGCDRRRGIVR